MNRYRIATVGSHSALQILKGAKDEGFETVVICQKSRVHTYSLFNVADDFIVVDDFSSFDHVEEKLKEKNAILIPHGSFVQYLGPDRCKKLTSFYYGNKNILEWESDRALERKWLTNAGLTLPRGFSSPSEIDRPVIVKFHGALGGDGYFIAQNTQDFLQKLSQSKYKDRPYVIQEYIVGVPVYIHYFYSPITNELEIMSLDRRYETNVDAIGRIVSKDQMSINLQPSYVVVGNTPLVLRESLLPKALEMGQAVVNSSKEIDGIGLFGPFCLETILTPNQQFYVFEISARIVAGTNLFVNGSPYTDVKYGIPMSTGRRIARDIRDAIKTNQLNKVLH